MAEVRPIDANAAKEQIKDFAKAIACENGGVDDFTFVLKEAYDIVSEAQTLDYAPVRHGEWVERKEIFDGEQEQVDAIGCSLCGKSQRVFRRTPYCPNCGAKMNGGKNDES